MIDISKAKFAFKDYLKGYDLNDDKINLKVKHTYEVTNVCKVISNDLKLDEEQINLAILIGLLHDIGRFEQLRIYNSYDDATTIDHADFGVKILFEDGLIRNFIEDNKYDNVIYVAIKNHNKYEIEDNLSEIELLHSKIIRDADKTDNFRVKETESFKALFDITEEELSKEELTEKTYNDFLGKRLILRKDRKTHIDMWVSYIAFIFDYNFVSGLKYILEKDYINILVDRIKYENEDTKMRMEAIRKVAIEYIKDRINN